MTGEIVAAIVGMERPEVIALKLGSKLAGQLLRHPEAGSQRVVRTISSTPGRLRLGVPPIKRAPSLAARLEQRLAVQPGVRQATANPVTGTALVSYDPNAITPQDLERAAELALAATRQVPADKEYPLTGLEQRALPAKGSGSLEGASNDIADVVWAAVEALVASR